MVVGYPTIPIDNEDNRIKKFIYGYNVTLKELGAKNTITVAPTMLDLKDLESGELKNPKQTGTYWVATTYIGHSYSVWKVSSGGEFLEKQGYKSGAGVRPLVLINY